MQRFLIATTMTLKPMLLGFQNPFTALLRNTAPKTQDIGPAQTRRALEDMAREVESLQPGLAAEIRSFSVRA